MNKRTIILIAYKFYPYPFVGANRWSNFVKHTPDNFNLIVITRDWSFFENKEVLFSSENVEIIATKSTLLQKLRYTIPSTMFGRVFIQKSPLHRLRSFPFLGRRSTILG